MIPKHIAKPHYSAGAYSSKAPPGAWAPPETIPLHDNPSIAKDTLCQNRQLAEDSTEMETENL